MLNNIEPSVIFIAFIIIEHVELCKNIQGINNSL